MRDRPVEHTVAKGVAVGRCLPSSDWSTLWRTGLWDLCHGSADLKTTALALQQLVGHHYKGQVEPSAEKQDEDQCHLVPVINTERQVRTDDSILLPALG